MSSPSKTAKHAFGEYAGMDSPQLPTRRLQALQVRLCRWQSRNFGPEKPEYIALGVAEEAGELCHAILKQHQGIRGMEDQEKFLDAAGDAIADCTVYLMQLATALRLDFVTLLEETAEEVMRRDWTKKPEVVAQSAQQEDPEALLLQCADCGDAAMSRHFSGVPGKGTLCLACHEEWGKPLCAKCNGTGSYSRAVGSGLPGVYGSYMETVTCSCSLAAAARGLVNPSRLKHD